ncbi:hypothetical protein BD410DRAFT_316242 [Rickenella mellea]|uniref:Uncharacterized protein n=1 Tax=Rickenella mellea TaxID=50990 RepID=A0A4Y7Q144_9AGAM|nr:hypothetical protein BD410DRAFT_316242 [Rickenella mellea]
MTSWHNKPSIAVEQRTIYPPVHRLPPEIMSKIFLSCLGSSNSSHVNIPRCSIRSPPLSISFVCQSWRTLALQIAQLWAAIAIGNEDDDGKLDTDRVKEWMARSHRCLFSLEVTFPRTVLENQNHMVSIISEKFARWKVLRLRVPGTTTHVKPLMLFTGDSVPQLEEYRLEYCSPHSLRTWWFLESVSRQLSTLCLQRSPFFFRPNGKSPYNLQHAYIDTLSGAAAFLAIIAKCPFLQVFQCVIVPNGVDHVPSSAVITSTAMHTLKISTDHYNIGHLLETLHLPSLERLTTDRRPRDFPTLFPHLRSMIERSRPPLRELGIWGNILAEDAIEILRLIPGLKSIGGDFMFTQSDFAVLKAMAPNVPGKRPLCPQVERFTVRLFSDEADRKLAWMLSSRWDRAVPQTSQPSLNDATINERTVSPPLNVVILGNADVGEAFSSTLGVSRCVRKGTKITTQSFESLLYNPSF